MQGLIMYQKTLFVDNKDLLKLQQSVISSNCRFLNFIPSSKLKTQRVIVEGDSESIDSFNILFQKSKIKIRETIKKDSLLLKFKKIFRTSNIR
jgi:hypothetical protein